MINQKDVCDAIKSRLVVQFYYKGHRRVVEPHLVGEKTNGVIELSAWQIGGYSESGKQPPWRNYILDEITNFRSTGENFSGIRPGYNPNDQTMSRIICRL